MLEALTICRIVFWAVKEFFKSSLYVGTPVCGHLILFLYMCVYEIQLLNPSFFFKKYVFLFLTSSSHEGLFITTGNNYR